MITHFPIKPQAVRHKHGGRITTILGITHSLDKPRNGYSRDVWYFVGDVAWDKGGVSTALEIAPWALCYDGEATTPPSGGHLEIIQLSALLNEYLLAHGQWCGSETGHEGWYAHRPDIVKTRCDARKRAVRPRSERRA